MSKKMQKYTLLQNRSKKQNKLNAQVNPKSQIQQFQALTNEVQQSKIAIENITSFGPNQHNYRIKFDEIQNQLQVCITNINIQSKRNKLLNQLTGLLKGQMQIYNSTEKKKQEVKELKVGKTIKKLQYQIDQVYQKHNQQIAKIHQLKQLANSRRSQRVVYSNLFKQLEKQIKFYEQRYKEQLIKCISLQNHQIQLSKKQHKHKGNDDEEETQGREEENFHLFGATLNETLNENCWNMYKSQKQSNQNFSKKFTAQDLSDHVKSPKEDRLQNAQLLTKKISKFQTLIEKIKVLTQCDQVEAVLKKYSQIQDENQKILTQINDCDTQIENYWQQINKLNKKICKKKFDRQYTNLHQQETLQTNAKEKENKLKIESTFKYEEMSNKRQIILTKIFDLFGLHPKEQSEIEEILERLGELLNQITKKGKAESKYQFPTLERVTELNREDSHLSETGVNTILERMQKFGNCQKIFDRKYFQQEYYKQLNKKKSSVNLSKIKRYLC